MFWVIDVLFWISLPLGHISLRCLKDVYRSDYRTWMQGVLCIFELIDK